MLNPRRVLSKAQILQNVWHYDFGGSRNVVETYVSYLRRKLDAAGPPLIRTVRQVGYMLEAEQVVPTASRCARASSSAWSSWRASGSSPRTSSPTPRCAASSSRAPTTSSTPRIRRPRARSMARRPRREPAAAVDRRRPGHRTAGSESAGAVRPASARERDDRGDRGRAAVSRDEEGAASAPAEDDHAHVASRRRPGQLLHGQSHHR